MQIFCSVTLGSTGQPGNNASHDASFGGTAVPHDTSLAEPSQSRLERSRDVICLENPLPELVNVDGQSNPSCMSKVDQQFMLMVLSAHPS